MRRRSLLLQAFIYFSIATGALAQDSTKIIVLSPRVGPVIDAKECNAFFLFSRFKNISRAFFFLTPDSLYACHIEFEQTSELTDTTLLYREAAVSTLAEKINHYEDLMNGKYIMGSDPASLQFVYADEIDIGYDLRALSQKVSGGDIQKISTHSTSGGFVQKNPVPDVSDILPFSKAPNTYFANMGLGIGYSTYSPDFDGLDHAFNTIENRYRIDPFVVPHRKPEVNFSRLRLYSINIHLLESFAVIFETGRNVEGADKFRTVSASCLYYPKLPVDKWARPYIGGGIGNYSFSGNVDYGVPIDTVNISTNGVKFLDNIKFEGGSTGYSLLSGIDFGNPSGEGVSLSLFLNYLFVPDIKLKLPEGETAVVRLSSFIIGGKIALSLQFY